MDMRSLNTSLPRASPRRPGQQTPGDILSAFKAAALSVTTLYKTAANDQTHARAAGYQDALEDLLTFLDKEDLGLGDGEGWRVRRWATERRDGSHTGKTDSDDDEYDVQEEEKHNTRQQQRIRSRSPEMSKEEPASAQVDSHEQHSQRQPQAQTQSSNPTFVFQSSHPFPTNHNREMNMDADSTSSSHDEPINHNTTTTNNSNNTTSTTTSDNPIRVEYHARPTRTSRSNRTSNNRQTAARGPPGTTAGAKRKIPFGDFFDISGLSFDPRKDDFDRGGKRRHV